jgi:hypothetical protein
MNFKYMKLNVHTKWFVFIYYKWIHFQHIIYIPRLYVKLNFTLFGRNLNDIKSHFKSTTYVDQWFSFSIFSCNTIGWHPKKDLELIGNRTSKAIDLFCILVFIWQNIGGKFLNLATLARNFYFFGDFFQHFKECVTKYSFYFILF